MSSHQLAYAQKRRSTRVDQSIPLLVQGVGALREPYQEQVSTTSVSAHGCSYLSRHEVIQGETVYIDLPKSNGSSKTSSRARVKWVQKTNAKDRSYQIAVELEVAGNIWGLPSPPEDWIQLQAPQPVDAAPPARELKVVPRKESQAIVPEPQAQEVSPRLPRRLRLLVFRSRRSPS